MFDRLQAVAATYQVLAPQVVTLTPKSIHLERAPMTPSSLMRIQSTTSVDSEARDEVSPTILPMRLHRQRDDSRLSPQSVSATTTMMTSDAPKTSSMKLVRTLESRLRAHSRRPRVRSSVARSFSAKRWSTEWLMRNRQ